MPESIALKSLALVAAIVFHGAHADELHSAAHTRPMARVSRVAVRHIGMPGRLTSIDDRAVWTAGVTIQLDGPVTVAAGGTLKIEAGTRIEGRVGTYLIVPREGRIEATGTVNEPIVFTCTATAKYPGCWGGVLVQGYARINSGTANSPVSSRSPTGGCLSDVDPVASPDRFGGCNDADDSGILTYLRIEYAERGLHLAAVGSGTVVHDIQANRTRGDGVLNTGGTVDVKDLFLTANGTGLRWTGGWRGRGQFIAVQQDYLRFATGITGQNGVNSSAAASDALPRSAPTLYNLTILAQSDPANASHSTARALVLERGSAATIRNLFFYAPQIALDITGATTCAQFNAAALSLQNIVTAGATSLGSGATAAGCTSDESALLASATSNNVTLPNATGQLVSQNDLILPDLRPVRGSTLAQAPAAAVPGGGFFVAAPYVGAIPVLGPGGVIPWFSGWTSPAPTPAPIPNGVIVGTVRSPFRGILGNTVVTDATTGATTTADASGRYVLTLPAGTALLDVSALPNACPSPSTRAGTVQPNDTTTLDLLVDCPPLPGTQRIAAGAGFACGIADAGTYCWGGNAFGELGNGTTTPSLLPVAITTAFTSISTGSHHTCGIEASGIVRCWGRGDAGQIGDGASMNRLSPAPGPGGPYVVVAAGGQHTCALASDGRAYCWGSNTNGQLGNGSTVNAASPVQVTGAPPFATLVAGRTHTCALDLSGAAWCWGLNANGQLGDGTTTDRLQPVSVSGGQVFKAIAAGGSTAHTCATGETGSVRCWGSNEFGQLGNSSAMQSFTPLLVNTSVALKEVAVGDRHTCGISASTSESHCWGLNADGQIGDGTAAARAVPTLANASARFSRMTGGEGFTCAVTFGAVTGEDNIIVISRRSLLCWGRNDSGQFGRGSTMSSLVPTAAATGLTIP